MKISQLEYFVKAAHALNYTKAAHDLYTSRQNVSHAVKALETELGTKLFYQTGNSLSLTQDGSRAVQYAEAILNDIADFKKAFLTIEPVDKKLFILLGTNILTYSQYDIPQALYDVGTPDFSLGELNCSDCYKKIVAGQADMSFIVCMPRSFPGCDEMLLDEDYLYLLLNAGSDLAEKSGLLIDDLVGQTLVAPPGFEFQMQPLINALQMKRAPEETIIPISSFDYVEHAIKEQGFMGIASTALKGNLPDGMVIRPLLEQGTRMGLRAIYKSDSPLRRLYESIISSARTHIHHE